jgi:hypothetical protein
VKKGYFKNNYASINNNNNVIFVNLKILKQFAIENLPTDSPLRHVLIVEDDEIPASELPSRIKVWLKLLQYSSRRD